MRLEILPGSWTLDQLQAALDTYWSLHDDVPPAVRTQIGLAAAAVIATIVEHGDATRLWVSMHVGETQMHLDITDDGSPAALNPGSVVTPEELSERGEGLAVAKAALGLFTYHRDQLGNHWRLISRAYGHGGGDRGV